MLELKLELEELLLLLELLKLLDEELLEELKLELEDELLELELDPHTVETRVGPGPDTRKLVSFQPVNGGRDAVVAGL